MIIHLKRAREALTLRSKRGKKSGAILIKENSLDPNENHINEHNAYDRTDKELREVFKKAGLELIYEPDFHFYKIENDSYELKYWALRAAE